MSGYACYSRRMSVRITGQSEQVTIRVPHELLATLRRLAAVQRRTYTALVVDALRERYGAAEPGGGRDEPGAVTQS